MLCGTASGALLEWADGRCQRAIQINKQQPIFGIHTGPEGVVVAGKGGRLFWWPPTAAAPLRAADARVFHLGSLVAAAADGSGRALAFLRGEPPCVRALAVRSGRLVFATRGGELWEANLPGIAPAPPPPLGAAAEPPPGPVSGGELTLLVQGHSAAVAGGVWQGEASALATHPSDADVFATGGDDGSVRLWSVGRKRMVCMRMLPRAVASLTFSSDGLHIAAGCAEACVTILRADDLAEVRSFRLAPPPPVRFEVAGDEDPEADVRMAVSAVAYNPGDTMLAAAGPDGALELLEVGEEYRRLHSCAAHSAQVLHVDWSTDGKYLQTACGRCELVFWEAASGTRVAAPATVRDVEWATLTCPLGWGLRGVYPKMSDGSDITAAHRSPDGRLVVTADEFRKINIFRYPSGPGSAACRSAAAHASHVGCVRFTADGKHLVSVGGPDLAVLVWKVS